MPLTVVVVGYCRRYQDDHQSFGLGTTPLLVGAGRKVRLAATPLIGFLTPPGALY